MFRYILRRLLVGIVQLFIFISAAFFLIQILMPGDYVSQFALQLSNEESASLREITGVNLPLWEQYLHWIGRLARGDLGQAFSARGEPYAVADVVKFLVPYTLMLFGFGTLLAFVIGNWIGKTIAWKTPRIISNPAAFLGIIFYTSFPPWAAFVARYFFRDRLEIFINSFSDPVWRTAPVPATQVMTYMLWSFGGVIALLWIGNQILQRLSRQSVHPLVLPILLAGGVIATWLFYAHSTYIWELLQILAIPFIVFVVLSFGETLFIARSTMMDTLNEDYLLTARAKGLPDRAIKEKHAARNAILPVISRLVMRLPYLLTTGAMLEFVLDWPGIGSMLLVSVTTQNGPQFMGLFLVIGLISLVARIGLDVLQAYLDPRIRIQTKVAASS
ncbi:MAG: ABC transporter permease [Chloroflexi bacterium]|nr:MAG: ABC transporter permease [Chloroflexota bacterium]MBL1194679.1 ABC transporter permease [Chloroflexota bacterium]NOH11970.1 ABC transporter permease [Chloroflexota bacterium]